MSRKTPNATCITCSRRFIKDKPGIKNCSRVCSAIWRIGRTHTEAAKNKCREAKLGSKNPNWKGGKPYCVCGKKVRHGAKHCWSCLVNGKILRELVPRGEKHYKFGQRTKHRKKHSPHHTGLYKRVRRHLLETIPNECSLCSSTKWLEVDHVKPVYLYPELAFEITNLRILCRKCHLQTSTFGARVKKQTVPSW